MCYDGNLFCPFPCILSPIFKHLIVTEHNCLCNSSFLYFFHCVRGKSIKCHLSLIRKCYVSTHFTEKNRGKNSTKTLKKSSSACQNFVKIVINYRPWTCRVDGIFLLDFIRKQYPFKTSIIMSRYLSNGLYRQNGMR